MGYPHELVESPVGTADSSSASGPAGEAEAPPTARSGTRGPGPQRVRVVEEADEMHQLCGNDPQLSF